MKVDIQNAGITTRMMIGFIGVVFAVMTATSAFADSPREQFNQMVEQLRKTPIDNPLREQIIKLAQELKPPQVVPEEARRAFVRGNTALSDAKGPEDYARAVQHYAEALSIAPWWGDIYFNNAKARELQQEYARAIVNVKLFLLTNPPPEESRKAKDYQYALEEKQERAAKDKANKELADRTEETNYAWLIGSWTMQSCFMSYSERMEYCRDRKYPYIATKIGTTVTFAMPGKPAPYAPEGELRATVLGVGNIQWYLWSPIQFDRHPCPGEGSWHSITPVIAIDKQSIQVEKLLHKDGDCVLDSRYMFTFHR